MDIDIKEDNLATACRQLDELVRDLVVDQRLPVTTVLTALGVTYERFSQNHVYASKLFALGRRIYVVSYQQTLPTVADMLNSIFGTPEQRKQELH